LAKKQATPKPKVANWRVFAGVEACQSLHAMKLTDVDLVLELEKTLDRVQKRLTALNKVRENFETENEEDQAAWMKEMEKEFAPSWAPVETRRLAGAGGSISVTDLKALRSLLVLK
jgi:hypothetical protein